MISIYHALIQINSYPSYRKFIKNSNNIKEVQEKILGESYVDFVKLNGVTDYNFYLDDFEKNMKLNKLKYVPTSGSTNAVKWIPYTDTFKKELWNASSVWLYDLYKNFPNIKKGKHFWSMSWLPAELRDKIKTDDLEVFSFFEKLLLSKIMAIDSRIINLPTIEESMLQSAVALVNGNVALISVWSPTFLLEMLKNIFKEKNYFLQKLNQEKSFILSKYDTLSPEFCAEAFPRLSVISCWTNGASKSFANELKALFPGVKTQGKGLWATEGVVTIPFQDKFVLSYRSHFYEFECVDSRIIYPSWSLKLHGIYSVIITTGSGLIRYCLNDVIQVTGFYNQIPCMEFIGREKEIDLVGEKLNHQLFINLIEQINEKFQVNCFSFLAKTIPKPGYCLLLNSNENVDLESLLLFIEENLLENFHYKLAREANQLLKVSCEISENPMELYLKYAASKIKIKIKGNIKVEPVIIC